MRTWLATAGLVVIHLNWSAWLVGLAVALGLGSGWPRRPAARSGFIAAALFGLVGWAVVLALQISHAARGSAAALMISPRHAAGGAAGLDLVSHLAPAIGAAAIGLSALALLGLARAHWRVRSLVRHSTEAPVPWAVAMRLAREQMGVHGVTVRGSTVTQPMLVGCHRPVVLVPAGTDPDGLSESARAMILAHELAHAARGDGPALYVAAIVRAALAPVLAVRWLLGLAEREREMACDRMVIAGGAPALEYARALMRLATSEGRFHSLALPFRGGPLLARVERLLGQDTQSRSRPGWALVGCLVAALPMGTMPLWLPGTRDALELATLPATISIEARDAAGAFRIEFKGGRPVGASADGVPLPPPRMIAGDSLQLRTIDGEPVVTVQLQRYAFAWEGRPGPGGPPPSTTLP